MLSEQSLVLNASISPTAKQRANPTAMIQFHRTGNTESVNSLDCERVLPQSGREPRQPQLCSRASLHDWNRCGRVGLAYSTVDRSRGSGCLLRLRSDSAGAGAGSDSAGTGAVEEGRFPRLD